MTTPLQPATIVSEPSVPQAPGLLDLEGELTCSICTDVLYQPLTLLDCLHTFCGSCLKEWFASQRTRQEHDRAREHRHSRLKSYAYNCPSCRAIVRETRPNATVTTLLDMYLKANPGRAKDPAEAAEIRESYTPGELVNVQPLPVVKKDAREQRSSRRQGADQADDQRDDRLIEDVRMMSLREHDAQNSGPRRPRQEPNLRAAAHDDERRLNRRRREMSEPERARAERRTSRTESLGHQSSLRRLLSTHELASNDIGAEIMRQIVEEGLLDGVDLENMNAEQENEISDIIVEAYRRRQRERERQPATVDADAIQVSNQTRPPTQPRQVSRPTSSRPQPSSAMTQAQGHRRATSQGNDRYLRPGSAGDAARPAARSATELNNAPRSSDGPREGVRKRSPRRATESQSMNVSEQWRRMRSLHNTTQRNGSAVNHESNASHPTFTQVPSSGEHSRTMPSAIENVRVSCDRCGRGNIAYELHYTCTQCTNVKGTFDLCRRCYRLDKGCRHWFGFGRAAWARFERQAPAGGYPSGTETPHMLQPQRYMKDSMEMQLQRGVFCDICFTNCNEWYWHCDECNEGAWAYCNSCVSQARHCTHSLLALALQGHVQDQVGANDSGRKLEQNGRDESQVVVLNPGTSCNSCGGSSQPRLHCAWCIGGDYDICLECYKSLIRAGRIRPEDGLQGWRKCPQGHRMMMIGAEERENRQYRIVLEDVVGGWSLQDSEMTASAFANLKNRSHIQAVALWPRMPDEGVGDELDFPRGAQVDEVRDVNGDWYWGVYCRNVGLFPASHVRMMV